MGLSSKMTWVFLSPHFDDAILSCGGLIWQQTQAGQDVQIWTVCAGEIPAGPLTPFAQDLHARWGTGLASVAARRAEDEAACRVVSARSRYFILPDCIYRRLSDPSGNLAAAVPVVTQNDDLWLPYQAGEAPLVGQVGDWIRAGLKEITNIHLVSPLAVGGHIDHRLVRAAAASLRVPIWYYADYPYSVKHGFDPRRWLGKSQPVYSLSLSPQAVSAWQNAVAAYASQISSFWPGLEEMHAAVAAYAGLKAGHSLWRGSPASAQ